MPHDQHTNDWPNDTPLVFSNNTAATTLTVRRNAGTTDVVNPVSMAPAKPLLRAGWGESDGAVSPDGKWVAFTSVESGAPEIHVRPFPNPASGGDWKISTGGGQRARWARDGRTICYQNAEATAIRATKAMLKTLGSAWDFDRATGRVVVTETVVDASLRIVVMQHWLQAFQQKVKATP